MALRAGLCKVNWFNLWQIIVEMDSLRAIQWNPVFGSLHGELHYVMEEVDLARYIHVGSPMTIELLIQLRIYWQRNHAIIQLNC